MFLARIIQLLLLIPVVVCFRIIYLEIKSDYKNKTGFFEK